MTKTNLLCIITALTIWSGVLLCHLKAIELGLK